MAGAVTAGSATVCSSLRPSIAVAESARNKYEVAPLKVAVFVPKFYHFLSHDVRHGIHQIFITIATWKNYDTEFHRREFLQK
jgi:hypothetical protein